MSVIIITWLMHKCMTQRLTDWTIIIYEQKCPRSECARARALSCWPSTDHKYRRNLTHQIFESIRTRSRTHVQFHMTTLLLSTKTFDFPKSVTATAAAAVAVSALILPPSEECSGGGVRSRPRARGKTKAQLYAQWMCIYNLSVCLL